MAPPDFDHTRKEKELIREFGGEPRSSYGADGRDGDRLVEVRLAKKDDRFRINQDTHRDLLRTDGYYIMDKIGDGKPPKEVPASEVQEMTDGDPWHSDRGYKHRFVDVDDIFK